MGTRYSAVSISGYNSSPPADDGSVAASNQITWAKHLGKIGNPLKTAIEAIDSNLQTALSTVSRTITSSESTVAGDHWKTVVISAAATTTNAVTVSLMDAATAANGYIVTVSNQSAVTHVISRATASDMIDGTTTTVTIMPLQSIRFVVSATANGYISHRSGTRALENRILQYVSVKDYGAVGDGTTDDTSAIAAAIAALSSGGLVYFPPGTYKVSSALTISTNNLKLYGSGRASLIKTSSTTADIFTVTGSYVTICDLDFQASVTRSGGSYINSNGASNISIGRFHMLGAYRGITVNGGSSIAIWGPSNILDTIATTGRGIYVTGTPYALTIDEIVMDASGTQPEAGVYINACGDCIMTRMDLIHSGSALKVAPGNGQVVSSLWAEQCFFDTSTRGIDIVPTGSGGVVRCRFSSVWTASMSEFGVQISAPTGTTVSSIHLVSPHIVFNTNNGLWVSDGTTLTDLSVIGGVVAGNVSGIAFANAVTDFTICDASIGAYGGFSANSGYGMSFAGQIANCVVTGNRIIGNTLGTISFGTTPGSNVVLKDNSGYNPQGPASITVTASPFTYTAGHTAETVFVSGGTVSLVKVAGTTVFATTNVAVPLSAGQACEVTYTVAPTMTKYRH